MMNVWVCALGAVVMAACSEPSRQTVPTPEPLVAPIDPVPAAPIDPGPPRRTTADQCDRACVHFSRLLSNSGGAPLDAKRRQTEEAHAVETEAIRLTWDYEQCTNSCMERATVELVDCILAATSRDALDHCPPTQP